MKEIRNLIRNLKGYPDNFFIYPQSVFCDEEPSPDTHHGLVVCDKNGEQQGFIETGTNDGNVII